MRGPKPTPTALKIVRGNPGKRALPKDEPKPEAGAVAPDWLSPAAAEHWPLIARQLEDAQVLTVMDAPALALYCEAFARWKKANDHVLQHGQVCEIDCAAKIGDLLSDRSLKSPAASPRFARWPRRGNWNAGRRPAYT